LPALLMIAALVVGSAACEKHRDTAALPHPLVVVGVDGVEWRLVLDMMKTGGLPELRRLMNDGAFARLSTLEPALSPPIWTSIATGVVPERHGILGFVQPELQGPGGAPLLFTNRDRRVKAIWNIAADAGLRSCVVGYWMTFPVEDISGVIVAQSGAPPGSEASRTRKGGLERGRSGQVHPPELEQRIFALAEDSAPLVAGREQELYGDWSAWPPAMKRVVEHSHWSLAADTAYQRIALDLLRGGDRCDVVLVYLGLPDVLGHRFWRWTFPEDFEAPPSADEVRLFGDVLRRAYAQVDRFVGQMRDAAGPAATLIVASDHGMGPWRAKARVDLAEQSARPDAGLLRTGGHSAAREAFFAGAGPGIRRAGNASPLPADVAATPNAGSILDMAPTLLALLGIARGADMDGAVATSLLDSAFLAAHPLAEVATHTPAGWADTRHLAKAEDPQSGQRIEQLRGLGYLE